MVTEVVLPMLGITIEKGKIIKWLKAEGDPVRKGEPIFEVETDKLVTEVESPGKGILKRILIPENVEVPVLTVVAIIAETEEEIPEKYKVMKAEVVPRSPSPQKTFGPSGPITANGLASQQTYDVAILGAGIGGYVAAIRAAQMGARVLLIEKGELGGTCINWGCIPTKSFLEDVKTYQKIKNSDIFVNGSKVSINLQRLVLRKNRVVETVKRGISMLLKSQKIDLVKGTGGLFDSKTIKISQNGKIETFKAKNMIIATGSRVGSLPNVKVDSGRILSSDDVTDLRDIPRDLLIIGGGVVGVEFATIFNGLGSKVTILEMLPQIISTEDEDVIRGLRMILENQGIQILTQTKVLNATLNKKKVELTVEREGKKEKFLGEKILMAVGRVPNTEGLNIEKSGVQRQGKFVKVNARMETNVDGIYAIGDVIGGLMLAHAASAEGVIAVENIMGKTREIDYQKIPSCLYTSPEAASVGLRESEAKKKGYPVRVGKFPYLNNGKALAMGAADGFVKIIAEEGMGQILGVHILGEHATELIGECLLAMNVEACIEDLGHVVKGHPTLSEIIMEAALDWQGIPIHLPKKMSR